MRSMTQRKRDETTNRNHYRIPTKDADMKGCALITFAVAIGILAWTAAPSRAADPQLLTILEIAEQNAVEYLWQNSIQVLRDVENGSDDPSVLQRYPEALDICTRLSEAHRALFSIPRSGNSF